MLVSLEPHAHSETERVELVNRGLAEVLHGNVHSVDSLCVPLLRWVIRANQAAKHEVLVRLEASTHTIHYHRMEGRDHDPLL